MMLHSAKERPPKKGDYICYYIRDWFDTNWKEHTFVVAYSETYNDKMDGWNVDSLSGREYEKFPDAWSELPTVDEIRKVKEGE